jgi:hypothetical protein
VMTQSNYETPGGDREWQRCWVFAKLMWNPKLDCRELMKDFIFGHYGAAAEPIWQYNEMLEDQAVKYKDALAEPDGGIRFKIFVAYLNYNFFIRRSWKLFDQAEAAAASDADLLERVQLARLPLMYVQLMQGLECVNEAYPPSLIGKFEAVARREGITGFTEGYKNLDKQLEIWRMQWQAYKQKNPDAKD